MQITFIDPSWSLVSKALVVIFRKLLNLALVFSHFPHVA